MSETKEENVICFHRLIRCSFCYRPRTEVDKIVSAESAAICSDCIAVCLNAIAKTIKPEGE